VVFSENVHRHQMTLNTHCNCCNSLHSNFMLTESCLWISFASLSTFAWRKKCQLTIRFLQFDSLIDVTVVQIEGGEKCARRFLCALLERRISLIYPFKSKYIPFSATKIRISRHQWNLTLRSRLPRCQLTL
jgi:hypothetical protein